MKQKSPTSALELLPDGPGSDASQRGRLLTLEFSGDEIPVLQKIRYRSRRGEEPLFWEKNHKTQDFSWTEVPQALSMLFVDYLIWDKTGRKDRFCFVGSCDGSHAASLGDAIYGSGPIQELLSGTESPGKPVKPHVKLIFYGDNVHGRATVERDRRITINTNFLPPDCVEIFWQPRGSDALAKITDLELLAKRLRLSLRLPIPEQKNQPEEKLSKPETPEKEPPPTEVAPKQAPAVTVAEKPKYRLEDFPECDQFRMGFFSNIIQGVPVEDLFNASLRRGINTTLERVTNYCETMVSLVFPPAGTVSPELFKTNPTEYVWPNDMTIWSVGNGDVWTLDDVTQGTLIMGATGSGKTTCSGRTIAQAMLAKQFGGLILTTKPGEAREWSVLCNVMGRGDQVCWLRLGGFLRLNLLDYETQNPSAGAQLTENLIGFFRVLLSVLGQRHGQRTNEGFWQNAGNQLLRNMLDIFLIGKMPLSLDRLAEFVAAAPIQELRDPDAWRDVPLFGEVIAAAENNATKPSDKRVVDKAKAYWLVDYPRLAPETRSCITFGFNAMLDVMRSRHIYELLCSETTFVPETIMNGHILIVDLPVKEFGDAGVLVQCAIKYLFQRGVERRQNFGDQTRPVFMIIDESQNFFTEYDAQFQQTARSSRVASILLSQNVNNFYARLGGDQNARSLFDSLAGNLNTKIFHANGDTLTNEWASKLIGSWDRPVDSASISTNPPHTLNPFEPSVSSHGRGSTTRREPIVFPEDFAKLRSSNTHNGFQSEAYIHRVGSLFNQTGLPFVKTTFPQIRIQETPEQF